MPRYVEYWPRPEVIAQGRRSPSEAMPLPRGSKPCAVHVYTDCMREGTFLRPLNWYVLLRELAARAAYSTRVIILPYPGYELLEHTWCFRQAAGREVT